MSTRAEEWDAPGRPSAPMLDQLAAALAAAQGEMQNPWFDSTNPHFRNKFASLAAVRNAVVPVLAKHGISMCQNLATDGERIACTTILTHASGQQMVFGPLSLPASKADAQGFGSAATYARRYSLMAVCGVVGDDDDDANAATGKPAPAQAYAAPHSPKPDTSHVSETVAREKATQMRAILESDVEEDVKSLHALDVHESMATDADLYVAASDQMSAKERSAWKAYVKLGKTAQHAPMNGARG